MGLKDRLFKRQDDDSNSNKQDLIHDGDDYINNPKKYDVYIAYSTRDVETANAVCHVLENNNMNCWIAPRNISPGVNYAQEISEAIKGSKIIVLIFSRNSMESKYVNNEVQLAFDQNKPILAFKIDQSLPCGEMEFLLKNNLWLDAYPSPEAMLEILVRDVFTLIENTKDIVVSHKNTG